MIKYSYFLPLFLLVAIMILTFFFIMFLRNSFFIAYKEKYSFMNRFPFESIYTKWTSVKTLYFISLISLFVVFLITNILYMASFSEPSVMGYAIFVGIMFILNSICAFILFFVTPRTLKAFKIYSVLTIVFSVIADASLGIISISNAYDHVIHKVIGAFAFILCLLNIILAVNPKLKDWDKLVEYTNSDGTIIYVRPKISPLSFSTWLNFLSILISESLILINMLVFSLVQ